jgi:cold shock CspA family protein
VIAKCAWWDATRGFVFLSPINGDSDVFCHHSGLAFGKPGHRNLERNALVEFEAAIHDGRIVARDVRLMEDENGQ